ncbi:MAG: hypothetical protein HRU03_04695 [Nanoarchaeales archaeon]|nr:hypothetical protein [Nanoarchaeales archaeon]
MVKKNNYVEKGSYAALALDGFNLIKKLSNSSSMSEKLIGLNSLLVVILVSNAIFYYLNNTFGDGSIFMFILSFVTCLIFGFISTVVYSPILKVCFNFSNKNKNSIRLGIVFLFISIPIAVYGSFFDFEKLINISLGFILIQLVLISLSGSLLSDDVKDKLVKDNSFENILGKYGSLASIISLIISIIIPFLGK